MKIAIASAALLCLLGTAPAHAKESCAKENVKPLSDAARAGLKRLAPPLPGAKTAVGEFYDASQCLSVNGGKKIRDWARKKGREREARD